MNYALQVALIIYLSLGLFESALFSLCYWLLGDFWTLTEGFAEGFKLNADKMPKPLLFALFFVGMTVFYPVVMCLGAKDFWHDMHDTN